jgi:hypothetical protein
MEAGTQGKRKACERQRIDAATAALNREALKNPELQKGRRRLKKTAPANCSLMTAG